MFFNGSPTTHEIRSDETVFKKVYDELSAEKGEMSEMLYSPELYTSGNVIPPFEKKR